MTLAQMDNHQKDSLKRRGRVYIRHPRPSDEAEFLSNTRISRALHRPWAKPPLTREEFADYLARNEREDFEALLLFRISDDKLVGAFNLSQIFRKSFQNAYLGYWVTKPLSRQGLMTEGLHLTLSYSFRALKLHRIEANIRPGNLRSKALAERCGFRLEGFSPRYLKIAGKWRDHERWAITREDFRGHAFPASRVSNLSLSRKSQSDLNV